MIKVQTYKHDKRFKVSVLPCGTMQEIQTCIDDILLGEYRYLLPGSKRTHILLKPNLNSDMIGLTGNTTDLRLIAGVVHSLQRGGYNNITVADGTSSGFLNAGINVMDRLALPGLAKQLGFHLVDLNTAPNRVIELSNGVLARVAQICLEADLFINLPKLKTHSEAGLSVAMKNMIGCMVGLEKQKAHLDLAKNIVFLNESLRPHLHIVDGIVAMEGTGPSMGMPIGLGVLLAGDDALAIDLAAAKLTGYQPEEIPYLCEALARRGNAKRVREIAEIAVPDEMVCHFERPQPPFLTSLVNHPRYRSFFARLRYLPGLFQLFNSAAFGKLLFALGGRQDMFISQDAEIEWLEVNEMGCDQCNFCESFCPLHLRIPEEINHESCIRCTYCYIVCPQEAVAIQGEIGHLKYQTIHYREQIVEIVRRRERLSG